jgi:hypothetical protein
MTNETLALLTPVLVAVAMTVTGGIVAWLVSKRHPVKKKTTQDAAARAADYAALVRPTNS